MEEIKWTVSELKEYHKKLHELNLPHDCEHFEKRIAELEKAEVARCYFCGREGVYGVDIVDTDYYDPISGRDTIRLGCKDVIACFNRVAAGAGR